jgi:hypothetical protein
MFCKRSVSLSPCEPILTRSVPDELSYRCEKTHFSERPFERWEARNGLNDHYLELCDCMEPYGSSSAHLNNCSDQVIDMAQVQQIYARLFAHMDVATSLLLMQTLVDVELVRELNQRIFTKLCAIQHAAPMRNSEPQFRHNGDVSNGPISLGDNDDSGSISQRSFPCISRKSPPWTRVGTHLTGLHHAVQILLTPERGTWMWLDLLSSMIWTTLSVVLQIHCVLPTEDLMHIPSLAKEILGIRKQGLKPVLSM